MKKYFNVSYSFNMNNSFFIFLNVMFIFAVTSCEQRDFSPDRYLSTADQENVVNEIVRYIAKLPPGATDETKFGSEFDDYYKAVATDYDIRRYFVGEDSVHYMLATRAARSIKPMRESIGIKIRYAENGSFGTYEEVFRTWKMNDGIMKERYPVLFELMVDGKDLAGYYPKSKGDQYIEFPDGRFYFDINQRKWRDHVMDSLNAEQ
jgi:hypothetical protein